MYWWPEQAPFVRSHDSGYGATEFNPRRDVSLRFRPFTSRGRTVPTLYGATSLLGSLSETLFHLLPPSGLRRIRRAQLIPYMTSTIAPTRALKLVDLRDEALASSPYGLTRASLIDSPSPAYPETAAWAKAFFQSPSEPDGLVWNSRQQPDALAVALFARGRVDRRDLRVVQPPVQLHADLGYERVLEAAESAGITIIH